MIQMINKINLKMRKDLSSKRRVRNEKMKTTVNSSLQSPSLSHEGYSLAVDVLQIYKLSNTASRFQ